MKRLKLRFPPEIIQEALTARAILKTGAEININGANIGTEGGEMIIDVPTERCEMLVELFESKGVEVFRLYEPISLDEEECINCGACISVCPVGVFSFDNNWRIVLDGGDCVQCGICITVCPFDALNLQGNRGSSSSKDI
jgi:ferredoxin